MPGGVIGNTAEFGSAFPGSSPGWAVIVFADSQKQDNEIAMSDLRTIILAAGKGVRMKSDIPKVLHPVCAKPIIQYVFELVRALGARHIYMVLGHKSDAVKSVLEKDVTVVIQEKLLGTADAVKRTSGHFRNYQGDVLILCGDTPLLNKDTIKELLKHHKKAKAACTFLTANVVDPKGYGRVIRDARGAVAAIREDKDATLDEQEIKEINVGVYCFKGNDLFASLQEVKINPKKKEYFLTDVVQILMEKNLTVTTVRTEDPQEGLGVNTRVDLAVAESVMRQRILKNFMLNGVTIVDPQTTYIHAGVQIGRDTTIRPFTVIENNVRIGDRCLIGPFCRLRPNTRIGNNVEIGNFTEVSRSKIGNQCFMKHFSFLGDAFLGERVNIGAGVVTANFDGKNKNKTMISNDAFIGSDSILVGPLKIGQGAVTGAGCVVPGRKNVPDYGVVAGVPARLISRRKRI